MLYSAGWLNFCTTRKDLVRIIEIFRWAKIIPEGRRNSITEIRDHPGSRSTRPFGNCLGLNQFGPGQFVLFQTFSKYILGSKLLNQIFVHSAGRDPVVESSIRLEVHNVIAEAYQQGKILKGLFSSS